jgi:hypothetical protein
MPAGLDPEIGEEKFDFYESMGKEVRDEIKSAVSTEFARPDLLLSPELAPALVSAGALDEVSRPGHRSEKSRSTW